MSCERLLDYSENLPQETPSSSVKPPPPTWPVTGDIKFSNLEMRYAPDLPLVLKGISFEAKSGERIGIVGGTRLGCVDEY